MYMQSSSPNVQYYAPPQAPPIRVIGSKYQKKRQRESLERVMPRLHGETPQVVFIGRKGFSTWAGIGLLFGLFLVINILAFVVVPLLNGARMLIVTDRSVYIFKCGGLTNRAKTLVAALSRPVPVTLTGAGIKVDGQATIYKPPWGAFTGAMREAAVLAQQPPTGLGQPLDGPIEIVVPSSS